MQTSRKVALRLREILPEKYVHMAIVGTDVPYAHVHLIPFNVTADLHSGKGEGADPDHEGLAALAAKLRFDD